MKRLILFTLAVLLTGGFSQAQEAAPAPKAETPPKSKKSSFKMPTDEQIQQACIDTTKLGPLLKGANAEEIIAVTTKVLDCIENSLFPETIKERLVTATATAIAIAGEEAPKVAVGLTLSVGENYQPYVIATSVLVAGEWADEVKAALLGAIPNREMVTQAAENPVSLVLGEELARKAIEAAQFALGSVEIASSTYFNLPKRPKGGLPGEEFIPRGEFYFGQKIFDPFTGRFIRTVGVFTESSDIRLIAPADIDNLRASEAEIREAQTLPFDAGFVDDRTGRLAGRFINGTFVPDTMANSIPDLILRTPGNRPIDPPFGIGPRNPGLR